MCGRYTFTENDYDEAMDVLGLSPSPTARGASAGELSPGMTAPVVAYGKSGKISSFPMRWGFRQPDGKLVINARAETADVRTMFRHSAADRRCLLPARAYYEWRAELGAKQKYAFSPPGEQLLYLCGLYRTGEDGPEFVILTREASGDVQDIHDRMPLMLPTGRLRDWLDRSVPFDRALSFCTVPPLRATAL